MYKKMIPPLLLGALVLGAPPAHAQAAAPAESKAAASGKEAAPYGGCPMGPGYGMGPGMMGGGYGMGPGMMGGGYGMGPGMMGGGYGMGPGMMGGGMMGGGYGMGPRGLPDLTADQRAKIAKIRDETRRKNWELMGQMMDEQTRLGDLYDSPKQDSDAITNSYKKISELQRRIYESSADAHKRMEAVLTQEQKEKWWRFWRQ